jgi:hypothetical protein
MCALRTVAAIAVVWIALVLGCSSERRDWRSAQAADTIESYGRFLSSHPEGELAADARLRIAQLAEDRDWKRAVETDTANGYERFLAQHPSGKWAQEARIRAESFLLADSLPTPVGGGSASIEPPRMPPPPPAAASFSVQLGAFSSDDAARREWQRLVERFPSELSALAPEIVPVAVASGRLHRLQAGVEDEPAARALCAALVRGRQACVVVVPPRR